MNFSLDMAVLSNMHPKHRKHKTYRLTNTGKNNSNPERNRCNFYITFSFVCFQLSQHSLGTTVCCKARWNGCILGTEMDLLIVNINWFKGKRWKMAKPLLLTCRLSKSILRQSTETSLCVHVLFTLM